MKRAKSVTERSASKPSARKSSKRKSSTHQSSTHSQTSSKIKLTNSCYLFFGGKGGVGKTTAACSTAIHLLETSVSNEHLLLFSTDPAHSLSDSLEIKIGDRLTQIARHKQARLFAFEMDAAAALEKFKTKHHSVLTEIAERGTLLDESDINDLLNLSLPGMDEVMALFELSELDASGTYTRLIIDTAPSGHTSRLLRLPAVFSQMIRALDRMSDKHRYIIAQFARGTERRRIDEVDLFLTDLSARIERVRAMLFDDERASFTLVTIPEAMAAEETARYFALLKAEGVPVRDLIVNRIEQEHDDCRYCHARVVSQKPWLKNVEREFKSLRLHHVPLLSAEVRGLEALRQFGSLVWQKKGQAAGGRSRRQDNQEAEGYRQTAGKAEGRKRETPFVLPAFCSRLLIFGGKGGVGKTTSAAAAALALSLRDASSRVLIFSTDPAHSLSDSFDESIGEFKQCVAGLKNLDAMEIDPARRFEELKSRYRAWIDELFETLAGNSRFQIQFEREAMREMVQLAPPGIDEIAALSAISDLVDKNRYSTIVLDTAPTGHLIRFLELPGVALSWVRTFIKLLLKYKAVVHSSGVAEELIALSKSIKRVIALLTDPESCEFVGVAIPERMSLDETLRLTETIERLKVPMRRLLINAVVPEHAGEQCDFCCARRRAQDESLKEFARRFKKYELFVAPQQPHEIHGTESLKEHFAAWQQLDQKARKVSRAAGKRKGASHTAGRR